MTNRDFELVRAQLALKAARAEIDLLRFELALAGERALAEEKRAREDRERLHERIEHLEQQLGRLADLELGELRKL